MTGSTDLLSLWREALQKWERQTNETLNNISADEGISQVMNKSLALMTRIQAQQGEAIERMLVRANLPSRADFRELGERLDGIEAQLADLKGLLQGLAATTPAAAPPPIATPRPARTRQPPQESAP